MDMRSIAAALLALLSAGSASGQDRDTRIPQAAYNGDTVAVRTLLKQKADVNAALNDGTTALHWAAYNDDIALVKLLIQAGAKPDPKTRVGDITPLALSAANGDAAIEEALLAAGANANAASTNGTTPLMAAAASGSVDAVDALIKHGAQVNARESAHGQTALMFAAAKDRAAVIRTLIAHGADPNLTSTVIHLERPRFDEDGNPIGGQSPRQRGSRPVTADRQGDPAGETPGEASGDAPAAPRPARRRTRLASTGGGGAPSGAAAAAFARRAAAQVMGGNSALLIAARDGQMASVRALLASGANINEPNAGDKTTPLVLAICNGHYDLAAYLLKYGADPNLATVDGLAALYAVIDTQWAPVGWAPNPITSGEAVTYLDLMKALLEKGANPNARLIKKLWFRPTHHDETWIGTAGATPFWRAAQATDIAAMRLLVAHGADPKIPSNEGDNALMVASGLGWNGNFSTQGPDTALATVKYCLELGLDPTPQDVQGYTALGGAAYRGDSELVKLLVSKGVRLDLRTSRGWSITDMANGPSLRSSVPVKHPETVALLLKLGAPPLTRADDEEILGIIRRRIPAPTSTQQ